MAIQAVETDTQTLWDIDGENTRVAFSVKNFGFHTVHGRFTSLHGGAVTHGEALHDAAIEVDIDAASIETGNAKRDKHLRSADFFDVAKFPTITFRSTNLEDLGQSQLRVAGDLTVRGTTRPVVLDAAIEERDEQYALLTATVSFDRRDFGVGAKAIRLMVGYTVQVRIELRLRARQAGGLAVAS